MGVSVRLYHWQHLTMQYCQAFLLCCLISLPVSHGAPLADPQVLFRDTALVHQSTHSQQSPHHSLSHHSHSVQDSTSTSHSHNTRVGVSPLSLHSPSLVQHADGRLFAVNANLQPGQFFQTNDGRIFTLATPATSALPVLPAIPALSANPSVPAPLQEDAAEIVD